MVKATPSATQDTTLLVMEVKVDEPKNEAGWDSCGHQIGSYTIALSRQSGSPSGWLINMWTQSEDL